MEKIIKTLAQELNIGERQVAAAVGLLDDGNTVPFIARYRKEVTGGLSDEQLRLLFERLSYLRNLEARKTEVIKLLQEMEKLTPEIRQNRDKALTLQEVADIYRPFRPKRRTRATIAREKGLEPLAAKILAQEDMVDEQAIASFIDPQKGIATCDEALTGALDIIAEVVSDDAKIRKLIRDVAYKKGIVQASALTEEISTYSMYYDFKEPVQKIVSHRILAINRGEREKYLQVKILVSDDEIIEIIKAEYIKKSSPTSHLMENAIEDAYKRLIWPSIEREIRNMLTEEAEEQALSTFSKNLKHLILQPPVKGRVIMGFDPAYRTGCKIVVIDTSGKLLTYTVCYPTPPQNKFDESKKIILDLIEKYRVDVV